jgi:hypothetical protein
MNENAFSKKSSIKVRKTMTGTLHDSVGFSRTDGPIMPLDEQLADMVRNGYNVERTENGIIITKIV